MEKAVNVAQYICNEYEKASGEAIDEMKLQKLLYFAQRESFAITGQPLFQDDLEGWVHGPVCPIVRQSFCDGKIVTNTADVSKNTAYLIDNIIQEYGSITSWKLRELSHRELSWLNSRKGLKENEIGTTALELEDIKIDAEKIRPYDHVWDMYYDEFEDLEEA